MWICPKCSRENGNSFNSCKGCGYVISQKEKEAEIERTKRSMENFSDRHYQTKTTYSNQGYSGPAVSYDDDDSYLEDYYSDDMFDDDEDYKKKSKLRFFKPVIILLIIALLVGGGVYYLDSQGIVRIFSKTDFRFTEDEGGITITGYVGKDSTLDIPDVIEGNLVTAIGDNAFAESNVKSVSIPNSVKSIGARAFYNCEYLHYVTLQEGLKTIGDHAFASNPVFSDVFIPSSVEEIGDDILKDSGNVYIQAVPGTVAMEYALDKDISYTPINENKEPLNITPLRTNDEQIYTTSKAGYGAGYMFSFVPYESSDYQITVEASIEGYLKIDDFGTMGEIKINEDDSGENHQTILDVNLKKEKKYYFAIKNEGTEENKNIEFSLIIKPVTDEQTEAEKDAKKYVGKPHTFSAYNDLFYEQHSETGETHYLEWNTNVQKVIDYYIDDEGSIWLCIYAPDDSPEAYNEYGEYIGENTDTMWWHKLSE